jgi:hypothetical protein
MISIDEFPKIMNLLQDLLLEQYGLDCDPFQPFLSSEETTHLIQAWCNPNLSNLDFKGITYDGDGGFLALWLKRKDDSILKHPVVFFGSEGDRWVVAEDFIDFLWGLAYGITLNDPTGEDMSRFYKMNPAFMEFASKYALAGKKSIGEIIASAKIETKFFRDYIESVCQSD